MKATHNSATGEPSHGLLSRILAPFSRCQSRNILEQLNEGVQVFDLRCRYDRKQRQYYLCHGLWRTRTTVEQALTVLSERLGVGSEECAPRGAELQPNGTPHSSLLTPHSSLLTPHCYVLLTYEGLLDDEERAIFLDYATLLTELYPDVSFIYIAVKLPRWEILYQFAEEITLHKDFTDLSRLPQCLLPIPRLWAWLRRIFKAQCKIQNEQTEAALQDFV